MDLARLIRDAQAGDREAFGALVRRYQDLALATAWARLRDPDRARDAAQDAFLDAFLHLAQLREPAAFPGWLRRVVWKHCDRQTRGAGGRLAALDDHAPRDPSPDAGEALAAAERRAWLRRAIEALPEHLRLAVALHHLGGEPQEAVAAFLELPLTTVKKRLHDARARLREESLAAMERNDDALRASASPDFEAAIELFLAVRAGDLPAVRALLDRHPSLANATEGWSLAETLERELPVATRATPLIRAAERGDVDLIDLLVERGAALDGPCACAGHETPLWAALAAGRSEAACRLLALGADPDVRGFAGHTPLHVAAIRGLEDAVRRLLASGADPAALSTTGETPLAWALRKGHRGIAALLLGERPPARAGEAAPVPARADAAAAAADPAPYETGIKAIDLFAPLRRGDLVLWHGGTGVGRNVLLGELARRAQDAPATRNLWALWPRFAWEEGELDAFLAELGLAGVFDVLRPRVSDDGGSWAELAHAAVAAAERLLAEGARHVVLALFRRPGASPDIDAALPRLGRTPAGAVTSFLLAPLREASERPAPPPSPPLDAVLGFDRARADARLFPALDPLSTRSRTLSGAGFDPEHVRVAEAARAHLAELRAFDPTLFTRPLDGDPARVRLGRARRLEAFLSQPFHTTEAFTGRPGCHVPRELCVAGAAAILDGACDSFAVDALLYRGALPRA
jgi:F-type H+-transporting ATPase subunit beta